MRMEDRGEILKVCFEIYLQMKKQVKVKDRNQ